MIRSIENGKKEDVKRRMHFIGIGNSSNLTSLSLDVDNCDLHISQY